MVLLSIHGITATGNSRNPICALHHFHLFNYPRMQVIPMASFYIVNLNCLLRCLYLTCFQSAHASIWSLNYISFEVVSSHWCISQYLWLLLPMFPRVHPFAYFQFLPCLLAPFFVFCIAGIPERSAPQFLGHFRSRKVGCRRGRRDVGTHWDCNVPSLVVSLLQS